MNPNMYRNFAVKAETAKISAKKVTIKGETAEVSFGETNIHGVLNVEEATIKNLDVTNIKINGITFGKGCICGEKVPGFTWNGKTLCLDCIHAVVTHSQARQSWIENNGDPTVSLREETDSLREELDDLKKELADFKQLIGQINY
jgi:hypothetical protein